MVLYYLRLHPLSKFPGPPLWAAFRFPFLYTMLVNGDLPYRIKGYHDRYGSVVRIGPDELSFIEPEAWKDIYMSRRFLRPRQWGQRPPGVEAHNLISAPLADHTRFRKALASAFSAKANKLQEPLITSHVHLLLNTLDQMIDQSSEKSAVTVDMVKWINFATFDITSDLGWGNSFGCLKRNEYHPWITVLLHYKALIFRVSANYYPFVRTILDMMMPASARASLELVLTTSKTNVENRLGRKTDRPDFMYYLMAYNEANPGTALSEAEIVANSMTLIVGGSDPVSTVLAGALNHLVKNPEALRKLVSEIRSRFNSEIEISAITVKPLSYLTAVLQEALRLCPPTPDSMRRAIPKGGATVAGHALPEGITVGVSCYAAFKSMTNFQSPDNFIPERWLKPSDTGEASAYSQDRVESFQPFGTGPHNCIGQSLAWMEMRIIMARLLWRFDVATPESGEALEWTSQKIYWAWKKEPVNVRISRAS